MLLKSGHIQPVKLFDFPFSNTCQPIEQLVSSKGMGFRQLSKYANGMKERSAKVLKLNVQ